MTENGEVENLEEVISGLVLDPDKMDRIISDLETYKGKPIFIEEFINYFREEFSSSFFIGENRSDVLNFFLR